jgi:hypothetical protein
VLLHAAAADGGGGGGGGLVVVVVAAAAAAAAAVFVAGVRVLLPPLAGEQRHAPWHAPPSMAAA